MWAKLEEVFNEVGLPYSRQGSFSRDDELPESMFTFWNVETPDTWFFDNNNYRVEWEWVVYFYTKDPAILYTKMEDFIRIAREKGFLADGNGKDIQSDNPEYLGRYVRLVYVENKIMEG